MSDRLREQSLREQSLRVVKLGGDVLATPELIADAARWVAERSRNAPIVVVASARRGVTDRLLDLVAEVEAALPGLEPPAGPTPADRVVASGEVVAASLLAHAIERLGVPAVPLDAREAGIIARVGPHGATIGTVRQCPIRRLLADGLVPVVMGFQAWHEGRVVTLGRGGSDTTAVALAAALGAERCELVKASGGLRTADPVVVPDAALLPAATYRFLSDLAAAGARVVSAPAAALALAERVPLHLRGLAPGLGTSVDDRAVGVPLRAIAARTADETADEAVVTVVNHGDDDACATGRYLRAVAEGASRIRGVAHDAELVGFRVARDDAAPLVRTLHAALAAPTLVRRSASA